MASGAWGGGKSWSDQLTDEQSKIKRYCDTFMETDAENKKRYSTQIDRLIANGKPGRVKIDIQDMNDAQREEAPDGKPGDDLLTRFKEDPGDYTRFFELSVQESIEHKQQDHFKTDIDPKMIRVGFDGYFGNRLVTPRHLDAKLLNRLIAVEGVVTRASSFISKIKVSCHYNAVEDRFSYRSYRDQLAPEIDENNLPSVNVMPKTDAEGNRLRTEHGLCMYEDCQMLSVQEMPEKAPVGQMPRSVQVRLEADLVDSCKPGDRVRCVGIYKPYDEGNKGKDFATVVVANNVILLHAKEREPELTKEDEDNIKRMAKKKDVFEQLANAVAPSIFGHAGVKKAILLQLLGGVEKNLSDNHHIRGDIHLLLVGEPATAKSQLLRFVLELAPLALSTTGKGSSGVGLTGAVSNDPDTGEKTLAAGAMVLADRGVLCIDEFDKMGDQDRVAMHEAMEQGSVTIAKAGIHASLNARCSVLAASNPVYGFYAVKQTVAFNVGLPDSLLSRFDLLFIILDDKTSEHTRLIADHVLRNHRVGKPITLGEEMREDDALNAQKNSSSSAPKTSPTYHDSNPYKTKAHGKKLVTIAFLRKYLQYAKYHVEPQLSDDAVAMIKERWLALRKAQFDEEGGRDKSAIYVSPRTLESLVRLSTAHAKCRLSDVVDDEDVKVAIELLQNTVDARDNALHTRKREREQLRAGHQEKKDQREADDAAIYEMNKQDLEQAPGPLAAPAAGPDPKRARTGTEERQIVELRKLLIKQQDQQIDRIALLVLREDLNQVLGESDEVGATEFRALVERLTGEGDDMTGLGIDIDGEDVIIA